MDGGRKKKAPTKAAVKEADNKLNLESLSSQDREFLNAMKDLCSHCSKILTAKGMKENKVFQEVSNYSKSLKSKNIKLSAHRKLYEELYKNYSEYILTSDTNPYWMGSYTKSISVHLGHNNEKIRAMNIRIPLSVIASVAEEAKISIDKKKFKSANQEELEKGSAIYHYLDVFHNYMIKTIAEALTSEHEDYEKLIELHKKFRDRTYLKKTTDDDGEDDGDEGGGASGLAKFINTSTEGSTKMDKKKIHNMFDKILENDDLFGDIPKVFEEGRKSVAAGDDKKTAFKNLTKTMLPKIENLMENLDDIIDGGGEEGSEEDSSSSESE